MQNKSEPKSEKRSYSFSKETLGRLEAVATELQTTASEVVRIAVVDYLDKRTLGAFSLSRMAEVLEYIQILLQHHVIDDDAAKHEAIVAVLDKNLIAFHGR